MHLELPGVFVGISEFKSRGTVDDAEATARSTDRPRCGTKTLHCTSTGVQYEGSAGTDRVFSVW